MLRRLRYIFSRRCTLKNALDIKNCLLDEIKKITLNKDTYVQNPGKDFTRNRKITFSDVLSNSVSMEAGSIRSELLEYFSYKTDTPTASAFIQQRDKISHLAFKDLFYSFYKALLYNEDPDQFHFFAVDGSKVNIPTVNDPNEDFTYFSREEQRVYCQIHLDAIYDLKGQNYVGAEFCPRKENNERAAFHSMFEELEFSPKSVFVFDRGYEGYALMAHIHSKKQYFVIRAKDRKTGGIIKGIPVPDTEQYDYLQNKIYVHRMKKAYQSDREKYQVVHKTISPYFLNKETKEYPMKFRVVRFKLDNGSYECLLTNLPADQFDINELKKIYHMRWGIETSFRQLKHTIGLLDFHSKKVNAIKQEIWARLIMFNFCAEVAKTVEHKRKTEKYEYMKNFTNLVLICRHMLLSDRMSLSDIVELIKRVISPIRPGRNNPRNKKRQRPKPFNYRKR